MPETLPDHVPSPRTLLVWDGTRYRAVRGHTDGTLQVRGEDQLFSYDTYMAEISVGIVSGADGTYDSPAVPAGSVWKVTHVGARDATSPTTGYVFMSSIAAVDRGFASIIQAIPAATWLFVPCEVYLPATAFIRVWFQGSLLGDGVAVSLHGYQMTLET